MKPVAIILFSAVILLFSGWRFLEKRIESRAVGHIKTNIIDDAREFQRFCLDAHNRVLVQFRNGEFEMWCLKNED